MVVRVALKREITSFRAVCPASATCPAWFTLRAIRSAVAAICCVVTETCSTEPRSWSITRVASSVVRATSRAAPLVESARCTMERTISRRLATMLFVAAASLSMISSPVLVRAHAVRSPRDRDCSTAKYAESSVASLTRLPFRASAAASAFSMRVQTSAWRASRSASSASCA